MKNWLKDHKWVALSATALGIVVVVGCFIAPVLFQDTRQLTVYTLPVSVKAVAISPDQASIVAGDVTGTITMWQRSSGMITQTWSAATTAITALLFSPDGTTLIVKSADGSVGLWSSSTHQLVRMLGDHGVVHHASQEQTDTSFQTIPKAGGHALARSADGRYIAVGGEQGSITIFDTETNSTLYTLRGHAIPNYAGLYEGVERVIFNRTGRYLASIADNGSVEIWDIQTGQNTNSFPEDYAFGFPTALAFVPDGDMVVRIGGSSSLIYQICNSTTSQVILQGKMDARNAGAISFWPDSTMYARGGEDRSGLAYFLPPIGSTVDTHIYIEQLADGHPVLIHTLTGHTGWVTSFALSEDGKLLVSGSNDRTVRLWDVSK